MRSRLLLRTVTLTALCLAAACTPGAASSSLVQVPAISDGQVRCQIAANHENPLVTEWPASEKANLEALIRDGPVVVSYSGCTMKMLPMCRPKGAYAFRQTTTATDTVEIHNSDELFAKLPLGALSLEGELKRSGRLAVQTTVSGQLNLGGFEAKDFGVGCERATHVVRALSVGTFKLRSGGSAKVGGSASIAGIGSGEGSSSSEEVTMREAGTPAQCDSGTDTAPHPACASPIQVFLSPLPESIVDRGPPGMIKARFLPVRVEEKWEVVVGDRPLCTTPCERWVDPAMPFSLKYDPGFWSRNQYWEVPDLRPHIHEQRVEVKVDPTNNTELVSGIMITSFAGIATVTGTVLTAAGCGRDSGMCAAGLITLPVGLLGLVPGIWMMIDAKGKVHVTPMQPGAPALGRAVSGE